MATQLPTNYLDPILDTSVNAKKLFKLTNQTTNEEMTVTIEDITTYLQIASTIGAGAFNTQNQVINSKLTADTLVGKLAEVLALTTSGSVADALVLKEMNANFQAGCSKIASAITANGVSTASNASPTTMATNIGNIRSGGTAVTSDRIISGYTAYAGKNLITGTNGGYTNGYNAGYGAKQLRYLGQISPSMNGYEIISSSATISATGVSGYNTMTADYFILAIATSYASRGNGDTSSRTVTNSPSKSYNASTGVLTVYGLAASGDENASYCTLNVYCLK